MDTWAYSSRVKRGPANAVQSCQHAVPDEGLIEIRCFSVLLQEVMVCRLIVCHPILLLGQLLCIVLMTGLAKNIL